MIFARPDKLLGNSFFSLLFVIFSMLHVLNSYRLNGLEIFDDIRYLISVMQFPIITICLIDYLKDNTNQIKNVEKGIIVSYTIIFVSVILSIITGTYNNTYTTYGITGWFSSANTQSMILTVISPLFIYFCSKKESYKYFIAIGIDEETRKIRVSPMFDSLDSFVEYIKYYSSGLTAENLADSSDITIELDESNHYIIKLKASIISAENITTTIISEEQEIVLTQNEFNNSVRTKIESIEDNLTWHKL